MRKLLFLFLLVPLWVTSQSGYYISGAIDVDQDVWEPKVYLSLVEAFGDMTSISSEMIFADARLSDEGDFILRGDFLPSGERLYRLHLRKKDDPLSTIIIGGNEHNHVHFAMRPGDTLNISSHGRVLLNPRLEGNASIDCMREAMDLADMSGKGSHRTEVAYGMLEEQAARGLVRIVEACPDELGSLFAAFILLQRFDDTEEAQELPALLEIRKYENSPYYSEVLAWKAMKYPEPRTTRSQGNRTLLAGIGLVVIAALLLGIGVFQKQRQDPETQGTGGRDPVEELSAQELRVLQMLAEGLTNKEISARLNIEVNTVKSHVSRIYRKLNISSRKQVRKFMQQRQSGAITNPVTQEPW